MNSLRFWRTERQLSQYELEEASTVRRWKIQLYEAGFGALSPMEIEALASALNVEQSQLQSHNRQKLDSNNNEVNK